MSKKLIWLLVIAAIVTMAGCKEAAQNPAESGTTATSTTAQTPSGDRAGPPGSGPAKPGAPAGGLEEVVLTVDIPADSLAQQPTPGAGAGAHGGAGCPMTESSQMLGIQIGSPHGIVVSKVIPGGPADKAGIKVGDSIVACDGQETTCPSSLRPLLGNGTKAVTVKLTISRPKA